MMNQSGKLFEEALLRIPGGVNSPVRAFRSVGGNPLFIARAAGSKMYDVDGREYIDYVGSWGPMILGHAHPLVIDAIRDAAVRGTSFGAPTEHEVEMAGLIVDAFPSIDMVRMVNSGTEATMSAIRLARGYTGREKIVTFDGCYHGHVDSLLVRAGSGVATLGIPGSPGIPAALAGLTVSLPYNDAAAFVAAVERYGEEIACVIVEPVAGNMGVVPPADGFLETVRRVTREKGIVLIFDEVITGFRVCYGGYQNCAGIDPDLTCLGKIIGGGLPVGAFGGRREIMQCLAPDGPVYQAGTLSGNPLAMAAGCATLRVLKGSDYGALASRAASFFDEVHGAVERRGIPCTMNRIASMATLFFSTAPVTDFATAGKCDRDRYARYFRSMLTEGIYLAPSQFEGTFLSFAHSDSDLSATIDAVEKCAGEL